METVLPFDALKEFGSTAALVKDLARRGTALFAAGGPDRPGGAPGGGGGAASPMTVVLRPSAMRIEYKMADPKSGVKRRVQLTPSSAVKELDAAESVLVTPHA